VGSSRSAGSSRSGSTASTTRSTTCAWSSLPAGDGHDVTVQLDAGDRAGRSSRWPVDVRIQVHDRRHRTPSSCRTRCRFSRSCLHVPGIPTQPEVDPGQLDPQDAGLSHRRGP
jgi:hypothetical protein